MLIDMQLKKDELARLKPITFPNSKGTGQFMPIKNTKGKSTKEVISEMKRISKKDVFSPKDD